MRGQFSGGAIPVWEFERDDEIVRIDPQGPLRVRTGASFDLAVQVAIDGLGIIHLSRIGYGRISKAVLWYLEPWWQSFSGPFLYYSGRRHLPSPLRAFVDFIREG